MRGVAGVSPVEGESVIVRRMTRQRTAIGALLDEVDEFRSAHQLHELLRARGDSTGIATVYRALQQLALDGEVDVLRTDDGESLFRRCERRTHHHHLVCRSCGKTVEIEGPNLETFARGLGAEHEFTDVEHTFELRGTCAQCAADQSLLNPAPAARTGHS
jgi:Fur family ferric uptake transcriptional regulator